MADTVSDVSLGGGPVIATAIHDGHDVRDEVSDRLALTSAERLREEDPYTAEWTAIAGTRIAGLRSRFEVDLNRPREKAVYRKPEDAWGLKVWRDELPEDIAEQSLAEYDGFYDQARRVFAEAQEQHRNFVVYDLHTYNHRRDGPDGEPAPVEGNPEVNLGTGTVNRAIWRPLIERFVADLRAFDFGGRHLDVRENVKFQGGQLSRWTHAEFPGGCSLAIEFKKFFMDEWTGERDEGLHALILAALGSTLPGVMEELERLRRR